MIGTDSAKPQAARAFFYLIWLSWQRQARAHLMVWIALGLLAFAAFIVHSVERQGRWSMAHWRQPRGTGSTYARYVDTVKQASLLPQTPPLATGQNAIWSSLEVVVHKVSGFYVFSNGIVFSMFATFLLPLWTLSFA